MTTKRINLNLNTELLEVIDAFAKLNNRSRTYTIEEFLMPSLPALKAVLLKATALAEMTDTERLTELSRLTAIEDELRTQARSMPANIEGDLK